MTWRKHRRAMESAHASLLDALEHGDRADVEVALIRNGAVLDQVDAHLRQSGRWLRRFQVFALAWNGTLLTWAVITTRWLSAAFSGLAVLVVLVTRWAGDRSRRKP